MKKGFTLIELLVVVLIIGILSAIALPQYEKTVEKSRATQALVLMKALIQAQDVYYLENGNYASKFSDLSVDIPFTGNVTLHSTATDFKSNPQWAVTLQSNPQYVNMRVGRISGKYQGATFIYIYKTSTDAYAPLLKKILCVEYKQGVNFIFNSELPAGAYCKRIVNGTLEKDASEGRFYTVSY